MENYQFILPNAKLKTYGIITFIMLSLNFIGFGFVFFMSTGYSSIISFICLFFTTIPWLYFILNKKHVANLYIAFVFIISSTAWFYYSNIGVGMLLLVFGVIGYKTNKKKIIVVSKLGIIYPLLIPKKYAWQEINNVILKDKILTIDLKSNVLHQININENEAALINEIQFNNFCKSCLLT